MAGSVVAASGAVWVREAAKVEDLAPVQVRAPVKVEVRARGKAEVLPPVQVGVLAQVQVRAPGKEEVLEAIVRIVRKRKSRRNLKLCRNHWKIC